MNLTLHDIDIGKSLSLRTSNIVKSQNYEWFLSFDNQTFTALPNNDVLIPYDSQQAVFVYLQDEAGRATPVETLYLSQHTLQLPWLSRRFYDILTGMLLLTLLYAVFHYRNSLILLRNVFLWKSKPLRRLLHHESSQDCHEDKKKERANSQSDKDDEQANLDIDVVRALVSKIDKGRGRDYHQIRVAQFNQLLRERQKYLQGKEISAAIDMSENQLRFSLKTVFGNGSIKAYIPIYLDIIKEEEGYDTQ
ncbi:MAG: hypothetical protein AAGB12_14885 [Pseudomonadota bacterium]